MNDEPASASRVPAGVPTGGQFASSTKDEADLALVSDVTRDMTAVLGKPDLEAPGYEEPRAQYEAIVAQLRALPAADAEQIRTAMDVAWRLHEGQFRRSTTIPYITHPLSNLQRLLDYDVTDPDMLAAAALHDCVEDCSDVYAEKIGVDVSDETETRAVTQQAIDETFGIDTGDIVAAVTNELDTDGARSTEQKHARFVAHARNQIAANFGAFMVKFSDFLDNAGTLKDAEFSDPKRKKVLAAKYLPLAPAFREVADEHERNGLMNLSPEARAELDRELDRIEHDLEEILLAA